MEYIFELLQIYKLKTRILCSQLKKKKKMYLFPCNNDKKMYYIYLYFTMWLIINENMTSEKEFIKKKVDIHMIYIQLAPNHILSIEELLCLYNIFRQ